jgi:hypothetical protein
VATASSSTDLAQGRTLPALTAIVAGLCIILLAGWLPHYLTWPWWPDLDAYAALAQGWDRGQRPYRDVVIFNFPGQIELFWILGKCLGWGRTAPIYAFDASLLVGFGILLVAWSRRQFRLSLPGLIGFAALLHYYLDQDYAMVAQRDWQAPLLALGGLLIVQAWPGRLGDIVSGVLLGLGMAIRPHVVLFAPAIALAIAFGTRTNGQPWRTAVRPLARWSIAVVAALSIAFAPLVFGGLMDDFLRGVRKASYGSGYNKTSLSGIFQGIWGQLGLIDLGASFSTSGEFLKRIDAWTYGLVVLGVVGLSVGRDAPHRRLGWAWVVALGAALLYAPIHPKAHAYLTHARHVAGAVGLAVLAGMGLARLAPARPARVAFALLLLLAAVPGLPRFWNLGASWAALSDLRRVGEPPRVPIGAADHFAPGDSDSPYAWDDYRRALDHVRRNTTPETSVANLLRNVPFPAFNGPAGRVTPLPGESGVIWLWSVEPEMEPAYADALANGPAGTVALWDPSRKTFDPRLELPSVAKVLRRQYRPEARFGAIEVWRKR